MVDLDALEAAGIANARKRAGLIEYLAELGFTVEEMLEAERRGRLFGLAGDVHADGRADRPTAFGPPPRHSGCGWTTSHNPGPCLA